MGKLDSKFIHQVTMSMAYELQKMIWLKHGGKVKDDDKTARNPGPRDIHSGNGDSGQR